MASEIQRKELEIRGRKADIRRWAYEITRTTNSKKIQQKLAHIDTAKRFIAISEAHIVDLKIKERKRLAAS